MNVPTMNGSKTIYVRHRNAGVLDLHAMFLNWLAFVPADLRRTIDVLALDNSSAALATAHGIAAEHIRPPCCTQPELCTRAAVGWGYRMAAVRRFLMQHVSVIVSDLDAIWLRDPRPYLRRPALPVGWEADLLAMGGPYVRTVNAGFVLYRPSFLRAFPTYAEHWARVTHHDQNSLIALLKNGTTWEDDALTSASRGSLAWLNVSVVILPRHQFVRTKFHLLVDDCMPNRVLHTSTDGPRLTIGTDALCIDEQVVVLHDRGELFRAQQLVALGAGRRGRELWRI